MLTKNGLAQTEIYHVLLLFGTTNLGSEKVGIFGQKWFFAKICLCHVYFARPQSSGHVAGTVGVEY